MGERESKNKNHTRETERKKLVHQKILKKKFVQRLFDREKYIKFFVYKLALEFQYELLHFATNLPISE
jgi:hypothetical protein